LALPGVRRRVGRKIIALLLQPDLLGDVIVVVIDPVGSLQTTGQLGGTVAAVKRKQVTRWHFPPSGDVVIAEGEPRLEGEAGGLFIIGQWLDQPGRKITGKAIAGPK